MLTILAGFGRNGQDGVSLIVIVDVEVRIDGTLAKVAPDCLLEDQVLSLTQEIHLLDTSRADTLITDLSTTFTALPTLEQIVVD